MSLNRQPISVRATIGIGTAITTGTTVTTGPTTGAMATMPRASTAITVPATMVVDPA